MANKVTLILFLFFVTFISEGYGFFVTWCLPHNEYFENIQTLLRKVGPQYDLHYSGNKEDTHLTVQRILERFNTDLAKQMSAKQNIENYTANKLRHYEVTPIVTGSSNEVDNLKEIFSKLDSENDVAVKELETYEEKYFDNLRTFVLLLKQKQTLSDTNAALEKSIAERNVSLAQEVSTYSTLQKIIIERGLA